ncbi:MAG: catecholate siderophore receptor [Pyrinomonadaceae bacterium]|jgi:catecholate siderophore receptor|nr:catecholate siderophore receptor [Pyrinomonadaceae bacterium]
MSAKTILSFVLSLFCSWLIVADSLSTVRANEAAPCSQLRGRVLDPNRAVIAGARITAMRKGIAASSALTNANGEFSLSLEPGEYTLQISAEGFAESLVSVRSMPTTFEPVEILMQLVGYNAIVTVTDMAGVGTSAISSATKTLTPLRDLPQSISVVSREAIRNQSMQSIADVVRYVPGVTAIQGENNRDQVVIRGNSSSADFFVDGVRDDVQYYRDLYNLDRVEALKGPNAMIFGRGGGGGVINRVTKQAGFASLGELTFQGGAFGNRRLAGDFDRPINDRIAFRFNGVYERSGSFREHVDLERGGLNPKLTIVAGKQTQVRLSYEYFRDKRTADRGIPSYRGRPSDARISTFFGNPNSSFVHARVNLASTIVDHQIGKLNIRNHTLFGDYDRSYQNFVPGSVNADETRVNLSAYNNATRRRNIFNQTDLTYAAKTGPLRHTLLAGTEFGRQLSHNFRNTGFFNNAATTISVEFAAPTINTPVTFRQNVTDADNRVQANIVATYAQDQIKLSRKVQLLAGIRFDHFNLKFHNNRNGENFNRTDNLLSPRAGIVFKPVEPLSLYGSYSISYLPSSGDQFSALTASTQTLEPEKFTNYEFGAKWDIGQALSLTTAVYRLARTNTRANDPNDPTKIVQTGSQRTSGFETGLNGSVTRSWNVLGGYAYQNARITSPTIAAPAGARIAQVPRHTFSLWNNYRFDGKWAAGLGLIHRSDMYAAIDDRVVLPSYNRADAAVFYTINDNLALQTNFENLMNKKYFINADGNDNILPGSPRAVRFALSWKF